MDFIMYYIIYKLYCLTNKFINIDAIIGKTELTHDLYFLNMHTWLVLIIIIYSTKSYIFTNCNQVYVQLKELSVYFIKKSSSNIYIYNIFRVIILLPQFLFDIHHILIKLNSSIFANCDINFLNFSVQLLYSIFH